MLTNRVSFQISATDFTTVANTTSFRFWGLGGYYYFKETNAGVQYQKASTQTMELGINMTDVQIYPINSWTFPDGITILKRQPPTFRKKEIDNHENSEVNASTNELSITKAPFILFDDLS